MTLMPCLSTQLCLFVLLNQILPLTRGFETAKVRSTCNSKLGMSSGAIADYALSSSSSQSSSVGSLGARPKSVDGWCPSEQNPQDESWIQVEFKNLMVITEIELIARKKAKKVKLPQTFGINYSRESAGKKKLWRSYRSADGDDVFPFNFGRQRIKFNPQLVARTFRLMKIPNGQCIQFEIFGCNFPDALVSYVYIHKPNIADYLYDGIFGQDGSIAEGGLGMLADGVLGSDNYRLKHEWVGWKEDSLSTYPTESALQDIRTNGHIVPSGQHVTILFEFENSRNFSYLMIHSNNYFHEEVQLLRAAVVSFSDSNDEYFANPIIHMEEPDLEFDMARPVMIPLDHQVGNKIRLDLYFQSKWLLISEVLFESTPVLGINRNQFPTMPRSNIWVSGLDKSDSKSTTSSIILSLIALFCCTILLLLSTLALLVIKSRSLSPTVRYRTSYKSMLHGWINDANYRDKRCCSDSGNDEMETVLERLTDRTATSSYVCPTLRNEKFIQANQEFARHFDCNRLRAPNYHSNQCNCYWEWNPVDDGCGRWSSLKECQLNQLRDGKQTCVSPHERPQNAESHFRQMSRDSQLEDSCRLYDQIDTRTIVRKEEKLGSSADFELYRGSFSQRCGLSSYLEDESKQCLVKVLKSNACLVSRLSFLRDAKLMENFQNHPNLLKVIFSAPADDPPHVVFEWAGLDLPDVLQDDNVSLGETDLIYLCCQLCRALTFLDTTGHCLHCDIAARNCFVNPSDLHLRLGSLALIKDKYAEQYWWSKGKDHPPLPLRWLPCDFFRSHRYTVKSSVWSLGITLWEILTRTKTLPYSNLTNEQVLEKYWLMEEQNNEHDVLTLVDGTEHPIVLNDYLRNVLGNCLQPNELRRPNIADLEPLLSANGGERSFLTKE